MTRRTLLAMATTGAATLLARRASGQVNIGISIAVPPPPRLVVTAPPRVVVVPGTSVYYVPGASFNLFVFGEQYYSFHNGAWFVARSYNGPWSTIAAGRVPRPVLGVPVTYYKIPPGHAGRRGDRYRAAPGHGRGARGRKGRGD